ncbi:LacI family DNA-binding transcriptional regulator [Vibrio hannami]|uniref:LacI family DNA-binding transcriptional regulator n=1 Tax=Vibrio hannami TaxID=2717094 RepID=UPI00240FF9B8|nr:LacI family DNA-binding transcriptional regulator [Vibrio hannami]MDG3085416.1 LacI family DNA-binding transcriptional regulator [Vibrio hannami]
MASLHDVARLAGVSKSTVSRVVNDEYGVKNSTKEKVRKAIEECGYVVNQVAKDLKSQKTNLIGVIVPTMSSNATSLGVDGLTKVFEEQGKHVLLANSQHRYEKELEYIRLFNQKRVEGIILYATHLDKTLTDAIAQSSAPVVLVGQDGSFFNIPSIVHDDQRVGFIAGQTLVEKGASKVGFIGVSSKDIAVDIMRYSGLEQALSHNDLGAPLFHSRGEFTIESGYEQTVSLLTQYPDIEGLFCATDKIAIGAIKAINESGKTAGTDIKVIGVGNDELGFVVTPSLTTFAYAFEYAGETAANTVLDLINEKPHSSSKVVLGFEPIKRETC